jgi:hypothetical protein
MEGQAGRRGPFLQAGRQLFEAQDRRIGWSGAAKVCRTEAGTSCFQIGSARIVGTGISAGRIGTIWIGASRILEARLQQR